ncbi:MAG TPA: RnfABCDGE type electron transport complex subunit G [Gammaproteobacteria bacterium]
MRTVLVVGVVAVAAALLLSASYELSKDRIAANERARLVRTLASVLDPALRDRDLDTVRLTVRDRELLGSDDGTDVFVAFEGGRPVAAVFASSAPDGYNAPIRLLIGLSADGTVTGVRVVSHRETPGLGDAIEIDKSPWITQFDGKRLTEPELWALDKEGGPFDSITGATITSRAVVEAVHGTLLYFAAHRDELFAAARDAPPAMPEDVEPDERRTEPNPAPGGAP